MKKKILIFTLCFSLLFTSINNKKSYANPIITANPIISASLVYAIGHIAYDLLGFVGDVTDIIDMGTSVYEKMTDKQKEDIKEQIDFNQNGFTYNEDLKSSILPFIPSKDYHYLINFIRPTQKPFIYTGNDSVYDVFDKYKVTRKYQGIDVEYMLCGYDLGDNRNLYNYYLYYKVSGKDYISSSYLGTFEGGYLDDCIYSLNISSITSVGDRRLARLVLMFKGTNFTDNISIAEVDDTCINCPHGDFNFTPNVNKNYPTSEELDYIDKNYPNLDNDIYDIITPPSDEEDNNKPPSDEEDNIPPSDEEDNNKPPSDEEDNNNTIISNPPKFPNLEAFDFSGLQLEPLSNLFSNFKNKFPFSLPFDLAHLIGYLNQDPTPPVFEADLFGETMSLDLTNFTELANILKLFVVVGYSVGLILLTKRFGG